MMIDPDFPHYTTGQFYLHWLVTNIPVSWASELSIKKLRGNGGVTLPPLRPREGAANKILTSFQGEWLRQGITYDVGEYIVGKKAFVS